MSDNNINEPMLEMYIFETSQMLDQLEQAIMASEKMEMFDESSINEIFRYMHTIKGSSAMMLYNNIGTLAHSIEDLFYFLREKKPKVVNCSELSDLVLEAVDFIKIEIEKIRNGDSSDGDSSQMISKNKDFLVQLKEENGCSNYMEKPPSKKKQQYYIAPENKIEYSSKNIFKARLVFQEGCEMENVRAFTVIHNLSEHSKEIKYFPDNILDNDESLTYIQKNGFMIYFKSDSDYDTMNDFFEQTLFLKELELSVVEKPEEFDNFNSKDKEILTINTVTYPKTEEKIHSESSSSSFTQNVISVNVKKLDGLMDLVGEMVIAEAMVTQNPEIEVLEIRSFQKAAGQLHKIASELQDMVMSIRMVPLSSTFLKMHRIVRDMCKKLDKEVELVVIGEETEVDKNIIEHISDPLMHIIRNSIDHGIEDTADREKIGKDKSGKITLEAKNSGNDVLVIIKDDGQGLDKEKIFKKASENGLVRKKESEMTEKEIFNLILLPGFSTNENVTEFSGRGVGMDVVTKNLESVGGTVNVDSIEGQGTTITLKIPLTLAIIDGMNIKVGNSRYTIPITAIKESFKPEADDCFKDPAGNEMIMVRGECYPILRLHKYYHVNTDITEFEHGILIMVEHDKKMFCIFADKLLGKQQVVVKTLPTYVKSLKKIKGLAGCTLLGDGSISLILDIAGMGKVYTI
ncbi:MAG: chemotaxis protein CheW [Pleomorphochaeta sp.]